MKRVMKVRQILITLGILAILPVFQSCNDESANEFGYEPEAVDPDGLWEGDTIDIGVGIQDAMVKVDFQRRNFRYYVPKTLKDKGVSLVFDFHGNMPYYIGTGMNPVGGFNEWHPGCKMADTANFILVKPVGAVVPDAGYPGIFETLGWNDQEMNARFVDKMVAYFKAGCKGLDMDRIYTTGVSSGGIFAFGIAALRSELIAASVPVAGQYSIGTGFVMPGRAVPIRNIIGKNEDTVDPVSAYNNFMTWAVNVAGCSPDAPETWQTKIYGRWGDAHDVDVTSWKNGKADMEFWLFHDFGHAIDDSYTYATIWEFMRTHPKQP